MSSHREPWIDRWWPLLLVCFGISFILLLALFNPISGV
jgi:hypothetical protein